MRFYCEIFTVIHKIAQLSLYYFQHIISKNVLLVNIYKKVLYVPNYYGEIDKEMSSYYYI